jgi:hypothetical protein
VAACQWFRVVAFVSLTLIVFVGGILFCVRAASAMFIVNFICGWTDIDASHRLFKAGYISHSESIRKFCTGIDTTGVSTACMITLHA